MQLSSTVLTTLLLSVAAAHPGHIPHDADPKDIAPHIARELVDKTPAIHVASIDKEKGVPVADIQRHISSDSCPDIDFTNNGNPILLLSLLNRTVDNCRGSGGKISITIEHPPFHGQDVFDRPRINLYGAASEMDDLSDEDTEKLKKCFRDQHRATNEWLDDENTFFAEFNVDSVFFTGDFGFGDFTGEIDGDAYHGADAPHQPPPCPWHLPPKHDDDDHAISAKKHHKGDKKENVRAKDAKKEHVGAKKHHGKHENDDKDEQIRAKDAKKHHGEHNEEDRVQFKDHRKHDKGNNENDIEIADSQTVFEILKVWFNNY